MTGRCVCGMSRTSLMITVSWLRAIAWFKTNVFSVECSAAVSRYRNLAFFSISKTSPGCRIGQKTIEQRSPQVFLLGGKKIAIVKIIQIFFQAVKKMVQNHPKVSKHLKKT